MNQILLGAMAGAAATVPMTAVMEVLHASLPPAERYPLPPREITEVLTQQAGIRHELGEEAQTGLTLAGHFAYGAACGAVFAPIARMMPLPAVPGGIVFGLTVWAVSYLGWLPALRILSPATRHPSRRNALMITAHVVWGAAAGVLVNGFGKGR